MGLGMSVSNTRLSMHFCLRPEPQPQRAQVSTGPRGWQGPPGPSHFSQEPAEELSLSPQVPREPPTPVLAVWLLFLGTGRELRVHGWAGRNFPCEQQRPWERKSVPGLISLHLALQSSLGVRGGLDPGPSIQNSERARAPSINGGAPARDPRTPPPSSECPLVTYTRHNVSAL